MEKELGEHPSVNRGRWTQETQDVLREFPQTWTCEVGILIPADSVTNKWSFDVLLRSETLLFNTSNIRKTGSRSSGSRLKLFRWKELNKRPEDHQRGSENKLARLLLTKGIISGRKNCFLNLEAAPSLCEICLSFWTGWRDGGMEGALLKITFISLPLCPIGLPLTSMGLKILVLLTHFWHKTRLTERENRIQPLRWKQTADETHTLQPSSPHFFHLHLHFGGESLTGLGRKLDPLTKQSRVMFFLSYKRQEICTCVKSRRSFTFFDWE